MIKKIIRKIVHGEPVNAVARWLIKNYEHKSKSFIKTAKRYFQVSGEVKVKINDVYIILWAAGDDALTSKLYYQNDWEKDAVTWFAAFSKQCQNVIDAGSNIGVFSILAAKCNQGALVHAFEPNPYNYSRLQKNIFLNFFDEQITPHQVALGENFNKVSFYVPEKDLISDVSSVYSGHTAFFSDLKQKNIEVECTTLDHFCKSNGFTPELIKIDVELYELQVLRGMKEILTTIKPFIFCEIFNDEVKRKMNPALDKQLPIGYSKSIHSILNEAGYSAYVVTPDGILYVDDLIFSPLSSMYLLLPRKLSQSFYLTSEATKVISELCRD